MSTEIDVVGQYLEEYQHTVYAGGRFWRCLADDHQWLPLPDSQVADEVLRQMYFLQGRGLSPSTSRLASTMNLLRLRLNRAVRDAVPCPPGLLPLRSHLLDLATGELVAHRPDLFPGPTLPYDYDEHAHAPAWQQFLESSVPEAAGFLQDFAGYCLTPRCATNSRCGSLAWTAAANPPSCSASRPCSGSGPASCRLTISPAAA